MKWMSDAVVNIRMMSIDQMSRPITRFIMYPEGKQDAEPISLDLCIAFKSILGRWT